MTTNDIFCRHHKVRNKVIMEDINTQQQGQEKRFRIPGLRWIIAGLLFFAAVLNYVDKNTLSLLWPTIRKDFKLANPAQDYANIQNAFQVAYTIALLASGAIVDKLGPRISMGLFVGWWSFANMLTSLAGSIRSLSIFRFMLGLGEAGNWTASPKTVSEWFPARERGLAIGIYTAGTPIGMTLAPLFIIWLSESFGWQSAFVVTGGLGLVWLLPWLFFCRPVKTHPLLTQREREWITADAEGKPVLARQADAEKGWSWLSAFAQPVVWCLLLGRMLSDPIWFFYQNWFPLYLADVHKVSQKGVKLTWIMFLSAGLGSLVGGWIAGRFMRGGRAPSRVRLMVMFACGLFMPLSLLITITPSAAVLDFIGRHICPLFSAESMFTPAAVWALGLASLVVFAHLAWLTNISALVVDVVPKPSLGVVFGIVAAGSSLGAIAMNDMVAKLLKPDPVTKLVQPDAYNQWYIVAAFLHLAVLPLLAWGVLRHKRLPQAA